PDDPTGARHRDVDDVRRADSADRPRAAQLMTVDRDRAFRRPGEIAVRSDTDLIHRYRFSSGVAELVHEIRQRALVERTVDLDRDARAGYRALRAEHAQLRDLPLTLR